MSPHIGEGVALAEASHWRRRCARRHSAERFPRAPLEKLLHLGSRPHVVALLTRRLCGGRPSSWPAVLGEEKRRVRRWALSPASFVRGVWSSHKTHPGTKISLCVPGMHRRSSLLSRRGQVQGRFPVSWGWLPSCRWLGWA